MSVPESLPFDPPLPRAVGRYEVVRLLGEGSMGRVLLAHDPVLDRDVAVKHLREDLRIPRGARKSLLKRMQHEARAAARVPHPNLVVLHDMGEDPAVGLYLVFEFVDGPTLKQRVARGALTPSEVARLALELGDALAVAHEAGILHRDVKPENVMLSRWGAKLTDFGIARIPDSTLTHQGGLMGTPAYSAPETFQAEGGRFSPASDQFSLAATLYEALSGTRAFPGDDALAVAARILKEPPRPFAVELGLPPSVDTILGQALARSASDRFPSARAFGTALARSLAQTERPPATPQAAPEVDEGRPPRRTIHVFLGGVAVVATAMLLGHAALRPSRAAAPPLVPSAAPSDLPSSAPSSEPPAPPRPRQKTGRSHGDRSEVPHASASSKAADPHGTSRPDAGMDAESLRTRGQPLPEPDSSSSKESRAGEGPTR